MRLLLCMVTQIAITLAQPVSGAELPGLANVSKSGNLRALLSLTDDYEKVRRDWEQPSQPQIRVVQHAKSGDRVSTVTIFEGCKVGIDGACDVKAKFSLETPDGKQVDAGTGILWASKPLDGRFMLGGASATIPIGSDWAAGRYMVKVTVTDLIASRSVELSAPFDVGP